MKLYYLPGSCALAVHIVLEWLEVPCEYVQLARGQTQTPEFVAINPAAKVPALQLDDGEIFTETEAILLYLAEKFPDRKLGPSSNIDARYQFYRWLSYLTGDVHPAFYPYFNPQRYLPDETIHAALRAQAAIELGRYFDVLDMTLKNNEWFVESRKTVLDAYLFVFCRWLKSIQESLEAYPNLKRYYQRLGQDVGVLTALEEESINL